jgi:hypothetical protein
MTDQFTNRHVSPLLRQHKNYSSYDLFLFSTSNRISYTNKKKQPLQFYISCSIFDFMLVRNKFSTFPCRLSEANDGVNGTQRICASFGASNSGLLVSKREANSRRRYVGKRRSVRYGVGKIFKS